jgi:hypothetical protein
MVIPDVYRNKKAAFSFLFLIVFLACLIYYLFQPGPVQTGFFGFKLDPRRAIAIGFIDSLLVIAIEEKMRRRKKKSTLAISLQRILIVGGLLFCSPLRIRGDGYLTLGAGLFGLAAFIVLVGYFTLRNFYWANHQNDHEHKT